MPGPRTVAIVGAGIAGLTLALGLAKFGVRVLVLEREPGIGEFGAGLQIGPNARKILDRLGLSEAMAERGFSPEGIRIFSGRRKMPLQTLVLGEAAAARYGAPYAVMHRGDLAAILHAATKRFANIEIVLGARDLEVETEPALSLRVREADGRPRRARPFALVGADGVRSTIRTTLLAGPPARETGLFAWRTLLPVEEIGPLLSTRHVSLVLGARFHLVVYPLPYRGAVNLVLFTPEPKAPGSTAPAVRAKGHPLLDALMQKAGESWTPWPLATVPPTPWHAGAVGLVGDAAHAMLPFQAQGAAMGIEDAAVLAPLLASAPDPATAFSRYAALRAPRVERVAKISEANGRIFHLAGPAGLARDLVIAGQGPRAHFRRLDWLYGYDPTIS